MSKKCSKCCEIKKYTEFHKQKGRKDGYRSHCKLCVKNESENYYNDNKEKILLEKKDYYDKNGQLIKEKRKEYVNNNLEKVKITTNNSYHKNKIKYRETQKKYRINNKGKIRDIQNKIARNKYSLDPTYKLKSRIKNVLYYALKSISLVKKNRTHEILGCSYSELKLYLESKFESWMNWNNHGLYNGELNHGWDIDHIIPLSIAKTEDDVIKLNHYTNLQPLCSKINRDIKRNNIDKPI
jgi:hypothetical protein